MLRGEISGSDDRLSDATLRAFDHWFTTQVDSVRLVPVAGRPDGHRPSGSDDSERGSSPEVQRRASVDSGDRDPDRWQSSSPGDLDVGGVGTSDDGGGDITPRKHNIDDRSPPPPLSENFDPVYDRPPLLTAKTLPVPVLPNRNAVYVADAILPPETVERSRDVHYGNGVNGKADYDDDDADDDDLEVVLPSSSPSPTRDVQMDTEFNSDDKEDQVSPEMDTLAQEEATDLSLPKQNGYHRKSSYGSRDERNGDAGAPDYLSTGGSSGSEDGSGAQSPMSQAPPHGLVPPHNFLLNPSAAIAAAGLFSQSASSLPPFYHHQRALQLAAMSRAAALGLPFHGKDVSPLASKPGIRPAHGYAPSAYSSYPPNFTAGKIVHTAHSSINQLYVRSIHTNSYTNIFGRRNGFPEATNFVLVLVLVLEVVVIRFSKH